MGTTSYNAELSNNSGGKLKVYLELYEFMEDSAYIVYCPALDLTAYGATVIEARNSFDKTFEIYINYCINKNTLKKDLIKHGWDVKSSRQKRMKAPTSEYLLETNKTLKDIILHKDYTKVSRPLELPQFC